MEGKPKEEITQEIERKYTPQIFSVSTFRRDPEQKCDEEYIKSQSNIPLTLEDLFTVAGETQKPVGIYVESPDTEIPIMFEDYIDKYSIIKDPWENPRGSSFFMIFDPRNLSLDLFSITFIIQSYTYSTGLNNYRVDFETIPDAFDYIDSKLYRFGERVTFLTDPMSRLYVAKQRLYDCNRPYFSSYVEEPRKSYEGHLYYSMILILLGKQSFEKLNVSNPHLLLRILEKDRRTVLDMIRVERAAVSALTLSRYLEEEELAKRIGKMTMKL